MSGTKDVGKQGKVVEVLHDLNAVIVEGCKVVRTNKSRLVSNSFDTV